MSRDALLKEVEAYYSRKLIDHGPTPQGVDWRGEESQTLRFRQLLKVYDGRAPFSLIDYGCGYGAMVPFVEELGELERYVGLDLSRPMLECARGRFAHHAGVNFVDDEAALVPADFSIASGVFNVKLRTPPDVWRTYVVETVDRLAELATAGFAFNMLTRYSDRHRRRDDLFYGDPLFFFDYCKTRHSRHVALLHDYGLYEFTILVRKVV